MSRVHVNPEDQLLRMIYGLITKFNWTLDYVFSLYYTQAIVLYELIEWENKKLNHK